LTHHILVGEQIEQCVYRTQIPSLAAKLTGTTLESIKGQIPSWPVYCGKNIMQKSQSTSRKPLTCCKSMTNKKL